MQSVTPQRSRPRAARGSRQKMVRHTDAATPRKSVVIDIMSKRIGGLKEVIGRMIENWMDEEAVPASWLYVPDDDPDVPHADDDPGERDDHPGERDDHPQLCTAADEEPLLPDEVPWWLTDNVCGTPEKEHAAWIAGLPADICADYLDEPYTGAGEAFSPGFTHHDNGGPTGTGFAAGGVLDQMPPGTLLAPALAESTGPGYRELNDSEQIGVLCGWQRQAAWAQAGLAAAALAVARRRDDQAVQMHNRHLAEHVPDELAAAL